MIRPTVGLIKVIFVLFFAHTQKTIHTQTVEHTYGKKDIFKRRVTDGGVCGNTFCP